MDTISLLKNNLTNLISANKQESISISKELKINLEELLSEPIKKRKELIDFLKSFELTMPSIIDENFQPIQLAKFKKANNETVSTSLIQNLEMIALLFREEELIDEKEHVFTHEYYRLNDKELVEQVFNDLNYQEVRENLYSASEVDAKYIFSNLFQKIYNIYGLRIFIIEANKNPFNFDGIYFDKQIATTFINAYNNAYSKTLFTLLHEMYHFFQDQGNTNKFDLFSESDSYDNETRAEDVRANKFAINFLLYNAEEELINLKNNLSRESLISFMKKYGVSRQAMGIELQMDLSSYKTGTIHKCYFNYSKSEINKLLEQLEKEGSLSMRKVSELKASITK